MVCKRKPRNGVVSKLTTEFAKKLRRIISVTFTKLLLINMVANNLCGFSSRCNIFRSDFVLLLLISFWVCGSSEKKATSEAEMRAEIQSKSRLITNAAIAVTSIGEKPMPARFKYSDSVSNAYSVIYECYSFLWFYRDNFVDNKFIHTSPGQSPKVFAIM